MQEEKLKNKISEILRLRTLSPIYAKLFILAAIIVVGKYFLASLSHVPIIGSILYLFFAYLILDIFFNTCRAVINYVYRKKSKYTHGRDDNFTIGVRRVAFFLVHSIFLLILIDTIFIDLKTLLTSITIAFAFIGIVFRDYITNFVNGVFIMFSRKFQLREYVKIGDVKGRISNMGFSYVELITDTKDVVYIPNNIVVSKEAVNFSKNVVKNIFVFFSLDRVASQKYEELKKDLTKKVVEKFPDVLSGEDSVRIKMESFEKDTAKWSIEYIVGRYNFAIENQIRTFTLETIIDLTASKPPEEKPSRAKKKKK